jgi:hypothetical protein
MLPSRLNRRRDVTMKPNQGEQDFSFFFVWGDGVDFGLISHFSEGNDILVSVFRASGCQVSPPADFCQGELRSLSSQLSRCQFWSGRR